MDENLPLTERKVVRRGLLAGLAGLGAAALMKVSGAEKAEAADPNDLVRNVTNNAATSETRLVANPGFTGPVFQVTNGTTVNSSNAVIAGTNSTNQGAAVYGFSTVAFGVGVTGAMNGGVVGTGVFGSVGAANAIGVQGLVGNGAAGIGVDGTTQSAGGVGVRGRGQVNGKGVFGFSSSGGTDNGDGSGIGVHGKSGSGDGVKGESVNGAGLRGTSTNFVGIVGISTTNHGLYGSSNAGAAGYGIVAENLGANGPGLLITGSAPSQVFGGLQVFGVKNAVLKMTDGSFASVYCQESPEPYFEDFGRAQLVGGVANVPLEREFATLVAGGDYHVFTHPQGDTRGLYVSRQGPAGFEVRECQGGTGNIAFSYRIVTRRKDIEGRRFARVSTEAAQSVAGVRAVLAGMGTAGSPVPTPTSPTVTPPTTPGVTTSVAPGLTVVQPGPAQP